MIAQLKKIAVLALLVAAAGCAAFKTSVAQPPLILVSIDGLRPDYLQRGVTPNLNRLAA
jgi:predicted AlkP superfamily pyrophosphatase or phosphodiesterase